MAEFDGEYLLSLARDKSGKRRKLLAETISDLFSGKGHVLTERERTLMFDILHKMVHTADRKSTRLNSSHVVISYAVFCLKKKRLI